MKLAYYADTDLRVIYVPDPEPDAVFGTTAFDLGAKPLRALRRRRKKQP